MDAACRFAELTGGAAGIGALEDAVAILRGEAGTLVTPTGHYGEAVPGIGRPDQVPPPMGLPAPVLTALSQEA